MTEESSNLQIRLRAGDASQPAVGLTAGEPVEPFTVGTGGSWQILAPSVAEVHAYLFFDGVTLYVSSVDPSYPAYVDGRAVGSEWMAVGAGSEIALGGARLGVEGDGIEEMDVEPDPEPTGWGQPMRPRPPAASPPSADEATVLRPAHEAGGKPKPKKLKIRQSARENPVHDDEATRFAPLDASGPPVPIPDADRVPAYIGGEGALPPSASSPPPGRAPWSPPGVSAQPSGPPPGPPGGIGAFSPPGVGAPVPGGAPMPGGPPAPSGFPPSGFPAGQPMPGGAPVPGAAPVPGGPPVPGGFMPGPQSVPGTPAALTTTQGVSGKKSPLHSVLDQWKNASIPQKAILVLMPFAFASMFIVFDDGEQEETAPAPAASAAGPSQSASSLPAHAPAVSPSASETVEAPAARQDAGAADDTEPPKLAKGEISDQRKAADALAAGNDVEALKRYEALAKEHPDNEAYKAAIRILRARANRK